MLGATCEGYRVSDHCLNHKHCLFFDADQARKSRSGVVVMWGFTLGQAWERGAGTIASSSGESEYYSLFRSSVHAFGMKANAERLVLWSDLHISHALRQQRGARRTFESTVSRPARTCRTHSRRCYRCMNVHMAKV